MFFNVIFLGFCIMLLILKGKRMVDMKVFIYIKYLKHIQTLEELVTVYDSFIIPRENNKIK